MSGMSQARNNSAACALVFSVGLEFFFAGSREQPLVVVVRKRDRVALPDRPVAAHIWEAPKTYQAASQTLKETDTETKSTGIFISKLISYDEPTAAGLQRAM